MLGGRSWDDWIAQYAQSHRNRWNQLTHAFGIPMIVLSIGLGLLSLFVAGLWPWALGLFLLGWLLQFIGHWVEGKPPEFFKDWRFLLVGTRWWWAKVSGRLK
ncbi:Mpo1-like protein [Xinfangfangia pollutisoli]|uniref:Mpo1-like protein n=1 Tax=Xinfangfangia pollutisoli TaxID=2865960 RepID=UPI001CD68AC7|nr:Mpo1-like protein [Xinfangfangia pollutisoli]